MHWALVHSRQGCWRGCWSGFACAAMPPLTITILCSRNCPVTEPGSSHCFLARLNAFRWQIWVLVSTASSATQRGATKAIQGAAAEVRVPEAQCKPCGPLSAYYTSTHRSGVELGTECSKHFCTVSRRECERLASCDGRFASRCCARALAMTCAGCSLPLRIATGPDLTARLLSANRLVIQVVGPRNRPSPCCSPLRDGNSNSTRDAVSRSDRCSVSYLVFFAPFCVRTQCPVSVYGPIRSYRTLATR